MKIQVAATLAAVLGLVTPTVRASEVERTIRAELSGTDASRFRVENLAGRMRITVGTSDRVTVVASVHAEDASLADEVRLERVPAGDATILRVRYPYGRVSTFRYQEPDRDSRWSFADVGSSESYDYDGHAVRVSARRGTRLHADLEIQVPAARLEAAFRNLVGRIEAEGLRGDLRFEVESADLRLRRLEGDLVLEGSSGDIRAADIRGTWTSTFESGDCRLDGFEGELFAFRASSGDLSARDVKARRIEADTSSGDVHVAPADVEEVQATAASGNVALTIQGDRLKSVRIDTSSGDVSLGLPADEAFDASADQASGDMIVGFSEGAAIRDGETLVGYRRGSGGAKIRVTTSSGDFSISPI